MKCPYCESGTNDFVPMNQAVEYSGIEMAVNRQGKLKRPLLFSTIKATPKWLRSLETAGLSTESLPFSHKKEGTLKNGYDTG
jgi:hypothetical protein